MKALIVKPGEHPVLGELADLKAMQECVGGIITAVCPWEDTPAVLVCDDEGLYHDGDWNRYICPGVAIKGTFFICGMDDSDDFIDISEELLERFTEEFWEPHLFIQTGRSMLVLDKSGPKAIL